MRTPHLLAARNGAQSSAVGAQSLLQVAVAGRRLVLVVNCTELLGHRATCLRHVCAVRIVVAVQSEWRRIRQMHTNIHSMQHTWDDR